jgi:hypothetical protein
LATSSLSLLPRAGYVSLVRGVERQERFGPTLISFFMQRESVGQTQWEFREGFTTSPILLMWQDIYDEREKKEFHHM